LDGIIQEPEYSYDVSISNGQPVINFSAAPDATGRIFIVYMGRQLLTSTPANTETHIDEFSGDGSTTAFTLTKTPTANTADNFVVFVDNVYQRLGASYAYTVSGETLTFTAAPSSGTNNIQVIQLNGSNTINTIADGTVTAAKIQDGQVTNAKLADSAVDTQELADGSVTAVKLADEYVDQTSATGSAELPVGTTAQRDGSPSAGYLRFNSTESQFEGYDGSAWGAVGGGNTTVVGWENQITIAEDYTITSGNNMTSAGPITIDSGYSVSVPTGSRWVIV
jgi:hypothetical protein